MGVLCFFNECENQVEGDSWKCDFHKHRSRCLIADCHNQVYARNLCVRHGGKKTCSIAGCAANARVGNLCSKHAIPATKKICMVEGCTKQAHARYKCVRHGGGSICKYPGCTSNSRSNGMCSRHGKQTNGQETRKEYENIIVDSFEYDTIQPIAFSQTPAFLSSDLFDVVAECFSPTLTSGHSVVEWDLMHI